jgi:hypothetical protein
LVLFLSYAFEDREQASELTQELENLGVKVWFAGGSVPVGGEIEAHVREGLKACHASVFLLSRAALKSAWVMFEAGATWYAGKTIFPVRIDVDVPELPDPFRTRLTCSWGERESLLIPGLADIARRVRMESIAISNILRAAQSALEPRGIEDPLVQLLAACLSPQISERRRAQALVAREPGENKDALLAAAERLTSGKDNRLRGEAYYLLGTVQCSKGGLAKGEDFFREAIDIEDSFWVQANCVQVLKGMVPLTEATIQRLQQLKSYARAAENNEQSELMFRVLDTLEAHDHSKR